MSNISTDASDEVEDLHEYIEEAQEENRKWRLVSIGLGALSILLGGLSLLLSAGVL